MTTASPAEAGRTKVGMVRMIAASVIVLIGIGFLAITFMNDLFAVGPAFEEMIDDFRPALSEESLATARADIDGLEAAGTEFQTAVAPAMAAQMGMSVEDFMAMVQSNYPDVATGMAALPEITATFSGLVDTLDSQGELFASADAIPTEDLPATTVPWIIALTGVFAIIVGGLMFMPGRFWPILAIVFGGLVVVASFALSLPQKSADADELNANLKEIYTQELIDGATGSPSIVEAMGNQMQAQMLPDLAAQLGMSGEELGAFMGQNFPATAAAMQTMPDSLDRFDGFVNTFAVNLDNYETIQDVSFAPIIWAMIIGSIIIILAGGAVVVLKQ